MNATRRNHAWACSLMLSCACLSALILTPSAAAETTHLFDPTTTAAFGSIAGGVGLAIDQSNGDVYAAALNGTKVYKYTAEGAPVSSFGGGTGHISGFGYGPWQLAVDQASHDLYVTAESGSTVYKFDSEGNAVGSFGVGGKLTVSHPIGVAVEPSNGNLYVASYTENEVKVFTSAGAPVMEFSTAPVTSPLGVAVNNAGQIFVAGGGFSGPGGLARFSPSGVLEGEVESGAFQDVSIDPTTQDVYASEAGKIFQYSPSGETPISNFGSGVVDDAWGVGVSESTGKVYIDTYYGSAIDVFGPQAIVADVTTNPPAAADVEHTTARLTGHVDLAGGPPVTDCEIEYGTTTEYTGGKVPCEGASPITASTDVSATVTNLAPLTKYHYRFVATNENGASHGQDQVVEPPAVFELGTKPATEVSTTTAILNGAYQVDSEGGPTHYFFEWGLTAAYGNQTAEALTASNGPQEVSTAIGGLKFFTLYHYRLVAKNSFGTSYGEDQTLKTDIPVLPTIDATSSSGESPERAVLEAEVNPGSGPTLVRFEYGQTSSYGEITPVGEPVGEDDADHLAARTISGLRPSQTYHYRAVAVNFSGRTTGPDETFTTTDTPRVSGIGASAISMITATLNAQVNPGFSPTTYHFEYGASTTYGSSTPESGSVGSDGLPHSATATIGGLAPGTTYHYRIVASNGVGQTASPDASFTTVPRPEEKQSPPPRKCKNGQVRRHGHCVTKHHRKLRGQRRGRGAGRR